MKVVSSKSVIIGLVLQGGGLRAVFSSVAPIILFIGLKIVSLHAPTCHMFAAGFLLVLLHNVLLHVELLRLASAE